MIASVLIVEDDQDIRDYLTDLLELSGYPAAAVGNGVSALDYLRSGHRPRVILLDLAMPEMDGRAFRAEQLRDPQLAGIPIVVCSAAADAAQVAQDLGADHVQKPFRSDDLLPLIAQWCRPQPAL